MNFLTFSDTFSRQRVVSVGEIAKEFPGFSVDNLTNWQKKGYLLKIRNGWYAFPGTLKTESDLFFLANRLYRPSYVSLETALRYYNFIPESVFSLTSITTVKPAEWRTPVGHFIYRSVKPSLFFGYQPSKTQPQFLIADAEKTLLDFLYLNPGLAETTDFEGLRFNVDEIADRVDLKRLDAYLSIFSSATLTKRWKNLQKFLEL